MGARKGQDNFTSYRVGRTDSNKQLVLTVLKSVRKGTVFTHLNDLIIYVAERTKLHRTTIKRNPEYFKMVLNHFGSQAGAVAYVSDEDASASTARAKHIAEQIKVKNQEAKITRLTKALERSYASQSSNKHPPENQTYEGDNNTDSPISDLAFTNTAMVLLSLLERLSEKGLGITVEPESMTILDNTEVGDKKLIAGPKRTRWFFEFLSTHPLLRTSVISTNKKDDS